MYLEQLQEPAVPSRAAVLLPVSCTDVNGRDLRGLPLTERKRRLAAVMPAASGRVLFLDSIEERGRDLLRAACECDLEGFVTKWTHGMSDRHEPHVMADLPAMLARISSTLLVHTKALASA